MKRIAFLMIAALAGTALASRAQTIQTNADTQFGGLVFDHDIMMPWDFAALSRPQNLGTSRAMAMGGAFTSLGADMTSMSLNPAGLGMYRGSEFSLTPFVALSYGDTPGTGSWSKNNKSRFSFSNVGAAFNVFESASGALTSVTIGFGMNRIADFNKRWSFSTEARFDDATRTPALSVADMFAAQFQKGVNGVPIMPRPGEAGDPNGSMDFENPYFWPATLGYKGAMIYIDPQTGRWARDLIGFNASMQRSVEVESAGSINEFDFSFGANIDNILYVGATVGLQSVYKRTDYVYGEEYGYFNSNGYALNAAGQMLPYQLSYADLWQRVVVDGSGVNFKLGVVVRPVAGLRLGVAFHTPTFYSLDRSYRAGLDYQKLNNIDEGDYSTERWESPTQYSDGTEAWEFVSPSRLMFGASYTFGQTAILSVDYERDWYNGIRVKNVPTGADFSDEWYKTEMKQNFCGTNTVRAGVEVRPMPVFALRAGGGYTSSMLRDESLFTSMPVATDSWYLTAGLGVVLSHTVTLDAAYQYLAENQSQYGLFYTYDQSTGAIDASSGLFDTSLRRHFITMTLSFRF